MTRIATGAAISSAILLMIGKDSAASTPPAAAIDLVLKPHQSAGAVDFVDIRMTLSGQPTAAGATLVRLPLVVASIPTQRYDGTAIHARDAAGELSLTSKDLPPTPFLSNRDWAPARATVGNVVLTFRARPRQVSEKTRNGPLFDLREEAGGLDGAGYTFLPAPLTTRPQRIHLHWDLSAMPRGSRGIWSLGEGDVTAARPAEVLQQSYYFAGPVKSYPLPPDPKFGLYWLTDPPFDAAALGRMVQKLFVYMARYFHDDGEPYRVFIRKQPYKGDGGTGLTRSFMFGWGTGKAPTLESLEGLLAHEMVHNWPSMDGDHADTSWYTEGTAEYYSVLLSLKSGLIGYPEFLNRVNERAAGYYDNPLQSLTNRQAEQIYWKDARAGHVPYGRGFMYLAMTDFEVRRASGGKRSLRDLVLAIEARKRRHLPAGVAQWERLVATELGPAGRREYQDMTAGKRLVPPTFVFGPCFRPERYGETPVEFGFDATAVKGPGSKIVGVIPGSAAARAGLRNGDEVVDAPDLGAPDLVKADKITLTVKRAGGQQVISYSPRGAPVDGYRWVRVPGVPDRACNL